MIFLTTECPYPPTAGSHIRDAHLIDVFRETMDVEVVCQELRTDPLSNRRSTNIEVPARVTITRIQNDPSPLWKRAIDGFRLDVQGGYSDSVEAVLRAKAQNGKLLWISRLSMAKYLDAAKAFGYRIILDSHQVETNMLWDSGLAAFSGGPWDALSGVTHLVKAAQCGSYEREVCHKSDAVVTSSDLDATRLLRLAPGAYVQVIPQGIDPIPYVNLRSKQGTKLLFSGALNYGPNLEGLSWYLRKIHPRLKAALGGNGPPLIVAGSNPPPDLRASIEEAGAEFRPNPASLADSLEEAAIVLVPLKSGRSQRYKILQAMAAGRSVVSTPRGAQGLVLAPGYDAWIADSPDKFASVVLKLLGNPQLREETGAHAACTIDSRYHWRHAFEQIQMLISRVKS